MKKYALLCLLSGSLLGLSQTPNYDIYDLRAFARDSLTDSVFNKTVDRYSKLWEVRLSPHGDFSRAADAMYEYVEGFNENMAARYASSANWRAIGPTGTNSTTFVSGNGIGRINRIAFSPNYWTDQTVYATSATGGLWRTWNDGADWVPFGTDTQLPISAVGDVCVHPTDPSIIFIVTGNADYGIPYKTTTWIRFGENPIFTAGVYRGTITGSGANASVTWECINGDEDNFLAPFKLNGGGGAQRIIARMNPLSTSEVELFVASSLGIFRTSDALFEATSEYPCTEAFWEQVYQGEFWPKDADPSVDPPELDGDFRGLAFHPEYPHIVYASGRNVYVSDNYGYKGSWTRLTGYNTDLDWHDGTLFPCDYAPMRINIDICPKGGNEDFLWAYIVGKAVPPCSANKIYVYRYDNLVPTWTKLTEQQHAESDYSGGFVLNRTAFAVDPNEPDRIYFGGANVWGSVNAGQTSPSFSIITEYNGLAAHADIHALAFPPYDPNTSRPYILYCGHDGGVSVKTDPINVIDNNPFAAGWETRSNGLATAKVWGFDDSEFNENVYAAALQDCNVPRTFPGTSPVWSHPYPYEDGYSAQFSDVKINGEEYLF